MISNSDIESLFATFSPIHSTARMNFFMECSSFATKFIFWSFENWGKLTPPHPNARARSFPVPSGRTPTAGGGWMPIWSRTDKTHPTVPSPPHARTRKFGTLRNSSKLWEKGKRARVENKCDINHAKVRGLPTGDIRHCCSNNHFISRCVRKQKTLLSGASLVVSWFFFSAHPIFGPPCVKSKTWRGFKSHWNFCKSFAPWLPPLFGFMNTSTGVRLGVGIGLITKVFSSFSLDFFFPAGFFFGVFLSDDLKLPRRGNFTIHDGGTIIREWRPVCYYWVMIIKLINEYFLKMTCCVVIAHAARKNDGWSWDTWETLHTHLMNILHQSVVGWSMPPCYDMTIYTRHKIEQQFPLN